MSLSLSRLALPTRLFIVAVAGLLAVNLLSLSAQAETTALGRVGGLVLDRANQPLPGATVTLAHRSGTVAGSTNADVQRH